MNKRYELLINGIVQGVGFRPYIYRLAKENHLKGFIINTTHGVQIEIEGEERDANNFINEMRDGNLPPLAKVISFSATELPVIGYKDFKIYESVKERGEITLISPDISICDECLMEMMNPQDRRYNYPFINCTNCGPRYTIIEALPYDRINTTMKRFKMCGECAREYNNPLDRRFHAQPNACFKCGPSLQLLDGRVKEVEAHNIIEKTKALLEKGYVVAIKGIGGFHLAADASKEKTILELRRRKGREEKPFACMVRDINKVKELCYLSIEEEHFLLSPQRPILLLKKKKSNGLPSCIAPHNEFLGIFLPYTPLHYLIINGNYPALIMTSGNISEEPICKDNQEAFNRLKGIADYFLIHDREIHQRCDDSVIAVFQRTPIFLRRSRGYAPEPIMLPHSIPDAIATGAHLKNTVCLSKGNKAFLSQYIGDLETYENYIFFKETISHLENIFEINPEVILYDMHPEYLSSKWAKEQPLPKIAVQHHEAHIAACMAEHHLQDKVLGIAFDGTGFGTDGKIWGSEFLLGLPGNFRRVAHFEYIPMPGGDKAAKEPWRMLISYLYKYFLYDWLKLPLPFIKEIGLDKIKNLIRMIENNINCVETCGCGRLFDSVAALIINRYYNNYEGQAPAELEMLLHKNKKTITDDHYEFTIIEEGKEEKIISFKLVFENILKDLLEGKRKDNIAAKFHNTLKEIIDNISLSVYRKYKVNKIILSGGCFQNRYLLGKTIKTLEEKGFTVYYHQQTPPNDGSISLGQIYTLAFIKDRGVL